MNHNIPQSTAALFIEGGIKIDGQHGDVRRYAIATLEDLKSRWRTDQGIQIIQNLRRAHFERRALESCIGRLYDAYDLRGIPLADENLSRVDLHSVDFFGADLRGTKFVGCNLANTHFSEADVRGADFSFSKMDEVFLDNSLYDLNTKFTGVDLRRVNFNLATLLYEQAVAQQRIAHLRVRHPVFAAVLRWTCNYGQSLGLWSAWVTAAIFLFAVVYWSFPTLVSAHSFIDSLYFSVTTFSTLGLGDILPLSNAGKVVVMLEVLIGYLMGGVFIAILIRRLIGS